MAYLWCYPENIHELKDRLLCTKLELESLKMEANEEMRKNKEKIKQFIHALNLAYKQRDEAICHYQSLLLHKIPEPATTNTSHVSSTSPPAEVEPDDDNIIDNFVKGRDLPQKGMLLKAVIDAGPLLQTVLVAGPLPQWRNPPPVRRFPVPPVESTGPVHVATCGLSVNFGDGSCLVGGGEWVGTAVGDISVNGYCQMGKRQRIW